MDPSNDSRSQAGWYVGFALVWDLLGTIAAALLIGWFIDRRFGTEPWAVTVFTLIGVAGGFVRLLQGLRRLNRADDA
jgi:ATP synthase protein I